MTRSFPALSISRICIHSFSIMHTMEEVLFTFSVKCFCSRIQVLSCLHPLYFPWDREHQFLGVGEVHSTAGACAWKWAFLLQIYTPWSHWQRKFKRVMLSEAPQGSFWYWKFLLVAPQLWVQAKFWAAGWTWFKTTVRYNKNWMQQQ